MHARPIVAAVALLLGTAIVRLPPKPLYTNLLVNGDAEALTDKVTIPGWSYAKVDESDDIRTPEYGSVYGEWDWDKEGTKQGKKQYFRLGWAKGSSRTLTQMVNVSHLATRIDKGDATITISGSAGVFVDGETAVKFAATLFDTRGKEVAHIETNLVRPDDLPEPPIGSAAMMHISKNGAVPAGTRAIRFDIIAKALGKSDSYAAFADNVSLVLFQPLPISPYDR
jgi:hypothetical protein